MITANDTNRLAAFVVLVAKMRAAQKAYFKTGGGLADAKQLEREVDRVLRELADREPPPPQLFS